MKISGNNKISDAGAFSVTSDADAGQDIDDVLTADFSTAYTSAGTNTEFTIHKTFTTGIACKYVAFSGHNLSDLSGGVSVVVKVNTVTKATVTFGGGSPNWVTMVHFDEVTATTVELIFTKTLADKATISYLAIGDTLDSAFSFPNQNVAPGGFPINWRTRSSKIRSVINDAAQPVANIRQQIARQTTLNLKNINVSAIQSAIWLEFLELVYAQGAFFLKDQDGTVLSDEPRSASMGFNVEVMPPKLSDQTRQLVDLSIKYSDFTGG